MNVAFYVDSLGQNDLNSTIFTCLNKASKNPNVSDVSLFYNNIDFNPIPTSFGIFNSTDLWNYTGLLVATTISNVKFAEKIANKFSLSFLFSKQKFSLELMDVVNKVPILVSSQEDQDEFFRLTGKKSKLVNFTGDDILEVLK